MGWEPAKLDLWHTEKEKRWTILTVWTYSSVLHNADLKEPMDRASTGKDSDQFAEVSRRTISVCLLQASIR